MCVYAFASGRRKDKQELEIHVKGSEAVLLRLEVVIFYGLSEKTAK